MKIYTKTGDDGTTGLIGGKRVAKSDARIDCFGTVDELNAAVGIAAVACEQAGAFAEMRARLRSVQNELFVVGSHLATPGDAPQRSVLPALGDAMIARLESEIDDAERTLPPLTQFILPGGVEAAARLHLARTICRRAERLLVGIDQQFAHPDHPLILRYLNRLSDWLFVQARLANHLAGVADVPWEKQGR